MKKEVFSARSGRPLAKIELLDAATPLEVGARHSFRIVDGFGNMWRKAFDEENMTVKKDEEDMLVRVVAFPAEEEGVGILDIDMTLPPRIVESARPTARSRSFLSRLRSYFSRSRFKS